MSNVSYFDNETLSVLKQNVPYTIYIVEGATPKSIVRVVAKGFVRNTQGKVVAEVKRGVEGWRTENFSEDYFRLSVAEARKLALKKLEDNRAGYADKVRKLDERIAKVEKMRVIDRMVLEA